MSKYTVGEYSDLLDGWPVIDPDGNILQHPDRKQDAEKLCAQFNATFDKAYRLGYDDAREDFC